MPICRPLLSCYHLYLVYILFGMPSLQLFTFLMCLFSCVCTNVETYSMCKILCPYTTHFDEKNFSRGQVSSSAQVCVEYACTSTAHAHCSQQVESHCFRIWIQNFFRQMFRHFDLEVFMSNVFSRFDMQFNCHAYTVIMPIFFAHRFCYF